jgi:hypothetical protein
MTLRVGRDVLFCTSPVKKHLARVRFGRSPLSAIGSGTSSVFDLIVTRSDKVVAQCNNPLGENGKKITRPIGRTEVVARSDKLESISISSRDVVRSNIVVAWSNKLVVVASFGN